MKANSVFMGIDAGTTKLKLMLYDAQMKEIGSSSRDTKIYIPENGASEIDMNELWMSLCEAAQELKRNFPEQMACLTGLGMAFGRWTRMESLRAGQSYGTIPAVRS